VGPGACPTALARGHLGGERAFVPAAVRARGSD
jgi:hypothetical protein